MKTGMRRCDTNAEIVTYYLEIVGNKIVSIYCKLGMKVQKSILKVSRRPGKVLRITKNVTLVTKTRKIPNEYAVF